MKAKQPAGHGIFLNQTVQIIRLFSSSLRLLLATSIFCAASASAANLFWDAGNTNNGATIDPASGFWDVTHSTTYSTNATTATTTNDANLGAGAIDWFQVNVPANALAATNILLYATNLPVNVWFSANVPPTTNAAGDALLMSGTTGGVSVLTTTSAPTSIVQGGTYYIGIDNSANNAAVGYAFEVDLSLTNAVATTSMLLNWNNGVGNVSWTQTSTTAPLNHAVFNGPDAPDNTYQVALDGTQIAVSNMTINASGYTFSGSAIYAQINSILTIASGKSVIFSNNFAANNNARVWQLGNSVGASGAPATMTVFGNIGGSQPIFTSTNGSTFYFAGNSSPSVVTINANVMQTNGTYTGGGFSVGRPGFGITTQPTAGNATYPGVFTLDGPTTVWNQNTTIQIARGGGTGIVIIQNGATANVTGANNIQVMNENSVGHASFFVRGGTLNMGNSTGAGRIWLDPAAAPAGSTAVFSQSGGVINAWGGIQSGAGSGTFTASTSAFTNSGGFLYIGNVGSIGISRGAFFAPTNYFTFSGGTVGALQSWISAVPMTLDTLNGNITFQCADPSATPFNISLSGALTGPGGLYKTGGGTLTLSGANNYIGSTVVSNGILKIVPVLSPAMGPLTLDGTAGSPTLTVAPASAGQFMTVNGDLTNAAGTVTADFNFGSLPPSTSVAPIQVANNVACTVTPQFTVEGSAIPVGIYPLIKYGGSVSGTLPTTPASFPALSGYAGYISNSAPAQTIYLVLTSSPVTASFTWAVGNGVWDFTTKNWRQFGGVLTNYLDPDAVQFDDTASGPFPITVTNIATVSPTNITVLGTNAWIFSGNGGSIAGGGSITKAGSGTLTLSGTNTYSGGTTVAGGQLNINNGGGSVSNSAIGTGPLTLDLGARVDNTSGQSVTLLTTNAQNWQDDWTYLGSANFNTGPGAITLGSSVVVLTVVSNTFEVDGSISDSPNSFRLEKSGSGTLTLGTDNGFTGGMQINSGLLQLKTANGLGNGGFIINNSATIDNISGVDLILSGITSILMPGSGATVTYLGTSNSLDFGSVPLSEPSQGTLFINVVSNTLSFGGNFTSGNTEIIKIGKGILALAGSGVSQFTGIVNEGELDLAHTFGVAIGTGGQGFWVQSNALVKITGASGNQISHGTYIQTRLSSGGVLDLNGQSQTLDMISLTNGVLRNCLAATISILTTTNITSAAATNAVILTAANNLFDVPTPDAELDINGEVTGTGSLVKTGLGRVNLFGTNSYSGDTIVSNGTLVINFPFLATNSTVTVNTNATLGTNGVLTLNFAGSDTNTIGALILGGVSKAPGIYNNGTDPLYIAGSGSLKVVPPVTINPLPGPVQFSVSGSTLALSWPTNLGWILQNQTNTLSTGLTINSNLWFDISNSSSVTSTNITINPANPTVFFRLRHP